MRLEENWAVDAARMAAFLREQADVGEDGGGFHYRSCAITLKGLQAQLMGRWTLSRTHLVFEGEAEDVQLIRRRIFLRFLSAGG